DRVEGVVGVGDGLALGRGTHQHLAVLGIRHDRRRGAVTLAVLDDLGLAALHDRHARVGRAEVDSDDLCHEWFPLDPGSNIDWGGGAADTVYLGAAGAGSSTGRRIYDGATTTMAGRSRRSLST